MAEPFKQHQIDLAMVDRKKFIVRKCTGKKVLDIGCMNSPTTSLRLERGELLFTSLASVSSEIFGVDIDISAIRNLPKPLRTRVACVDVHDEAQLRDRARIDPNVIVMAEILEHLINPGQALTAVRNVFPWAVLIVTVPNALHYLNALWASRGIEVVHEDHVAWYSPVTIRGLLTRSGWKVEQMFAWTQYDAPTASYGLGNVAAPGLTVIARAKI